MRDLLALAPFSKTRQNEGLVAALRGIMRFLRLTAEGRDGERDFYAFDALAKYGADEAPALPSAIAQRSASCLERQGTTLSSGSPTDSIRRPPRRSWTRSRCLLSRDAARNRAARLWRARLPDRWRGNRTRHRAHSSPLDGPRLHPGGRSGRVRRWRRSRGAPGTREPPLRRRGDRHGHRRGVLATGCLRLTGESVGRQFAEVALNILLLVPSATLRGCDRRTCGGAGRSRASGTSLALGGLDGSALTEMPHVLPTLGQ